MWTVCSLHTLNGLVIRYLLPNMTAPGTSRSDTGMTPGSSCGITLLRGTSLKKKHLSLQGTVYTFRKNGGTIFTVKKVLFARKVRSVPLGTSVSLLHPPFPVEDSRVEGIDDDQDEYAEVYHDK